ncbi:hypothetical protein LLG88_00700 [bacterium]|nr:hypothetical protein [bacterium]
MIQIAWWMYPVAVVVGLLVLAWLLGLRYIPHNKVGVIEKLWSARGSLSGGRIVAAQGEAGFQARLLRGGLHLGYFPWQYRIRRQPLVVVAEGKIGYVYARDGQPLPPTQTLGRTVDCNHFQDAAAFLAGGGQRGRQRAVLREGVFAVNLALFVVITEDVVLCGPIREQNEDKYRDWQGQLRAIGGFEPVVVGHGGRQAEAEVAQAPTGGEMRLGPTDTIGVVTVHDGPPIETGEVIAPEVRAAGGDGHQYFQDIEAFLALGGKRGKQLQVLTDGTFFVNRWFATVEIRPKTLIPIGYVGAVVSYFGERGKDITGDAFRYGEQVETGERGVWKRALAPGKYALNPYAMKVELVPTVNFVLRWITGQMEAHQYDRDLTSIELITADGYEPVLPLSLVLHIDYEKGPSVIQRFGDVRRLISQTLDPILTAYFRDVAQSSNMLDLLTRREEIQARATVELGKRFKEYDINCIAVLIGRPESKVAAGAADPIEALFDQLRARRLAEEQKATYAKQEEAAGKLKELNDAQAAAAKQTELTQTRVDVEIAGNRGEAQLAEARRLAQRDVVRADGDARARELQGRGEGARVAQIGLAEAAVFLQKIRAYGDPRLFALNLVAERFAQSAQPIVPERLFVLGGGAGERPETGAAGGGANVLNQLLALLLAEKAGFAPGEAPRGLDELERYAEELTRRFARGEAPAPGGDAPASGGAPAA